MLRWDVGEEGKAFGEESEVQSVAVTSFLHFRQETRRLIPEGKHRELHKLLVDLKRTDHPVI